MLSHATTRDWLIPYADGMLAADERRRIDGHITGCPTCARELREVRELNLLLVTLPPAPPVAFAPFWRRAECCGFLGFNPIGASASPSPWPRPPHPAPGAAHLRHRPRSRTILFTRSNNSKRACAWRSR